jgi:hypothetical protein
MRGVGSSLRAFLIAPAVPAILILAAAIVQGSGADGIWWMTIILPVSYVTCAVVGLPIHLILMRTGYTSLLLYVISGLVATLVPIYFLFIYSDESPTPWAGLLQVHFEIMGFMAFCGILTSAIFWLIARPDRRDPPAPSTPRT